MQAPERTYLPEDYEIYIAKSDAACEQWLAANPAPVYGFDCERKIETAEPQLLQFATLKRCLMVPCPMGRTFPSIIQLLIDQRTAKAGVHLGSDTVELFRHKYIPDNPMAKVGKRPVPFHSRGWFDLGLYARNHLMIPAPGVTPENPRGGNHSLVSLCSALLPGLAYAKKRDLQLTDDWSMEKLTPQLIRYAAEDAYLSLLLFHEAVRRGQPPST